MAKSGLKPKCPGSQVCVLGPLWLAAEKHFQGSLRTLTFEYDLRYIKHSHAIQRGSQHFRQGISGRCQVPWSLKAIALGVCVVSRTAAENGDEKFRLWSRTAWVQTSRGPPLTSCELLSSGSSSDIPPTGLLKASVHVESVWNSVQQ